MTNHKSSRKCGARWRPAGVCASPFRAGIKHGPRLAGVVAGIAGVVTVGRTYGASLFGRMSTYINMFIAIIPHKGGCNSSIGSIGCTSPRYIDSEVSTCVNSQFRQDTGSEEVINKHCRHENLQFRWKFFGPTYRKPDTGYPNHCKARENWRQRTHPPRQQTQNGERNDYENCSQHPSSRVEAPTHQPRRVFVGLTLLRVGCRAIFGRLGGHRRGRVEE